MREVAVIGVGPAGSAAALAALDLGYAVKLYSRTPRPRHRVCGEFLSPEFVRVAEALGVWSPLEAAGAAPIRWMRLHIGGKERRYDLPENAWGLSRLRLDAVLLQVAVERGATLVRSSPAAPSSPAVIATGRRHVSAQPRPERLFGFKAHFRGPVDDAVELHFFPGGYAGVSPVEGGLTNVCGIAPLQLIETFACDFDALLAGVPSLRTRLGPLERCWDWMVTGPVCPTGLPQVHEAGRYAAGDALAFADPFTGSGLSSALITGRLAGRAAARGDPVDAYYRRCRRALGDVLRNAAWFRRILDSGWAETLAGLAPCSWLFRLTRPRVI